MNIKKKITLTFIITTVVNLIATIACGLIISGIMFSSVEGLQEEVAEDMEEVVSTRTRNFFLSSLKDNIESSSDIISYELGRVNSYLDILEKQVVTAIEAPEFHAESEPVKKADASDKGGETRTRSIVWDESSFGDVDMEGFLRAISEFSPVLDSVGVMQDSILGTYIYLENKALVASGYGSNSIFFDENGDYLTTKEMGLNDIMGDLRLEKRQLIGRWIDEEAGRTLDYIQIIRPTYYNGDIIGFVGVNIDTKIMYDVVDNEWENYESHSAIISNLGYVLYSSDQEGDLMHHVMGEVDTIYSSSNIELRELFREAKSHPRTQSGAINITEGNIHINGMDSMVALAPIENTDGWLVVRAIYANVLEETTTQISDYVTGLVTDRLYAILGLVIMGLAIIAAIFVLLSIISLFSTSFFMGYFIKPIKVLTQKVSDMDGDNLDFEWDIKTRDETQVLASAFMRLTERMKAYIVDLREVTAAQEKIESELSMASSIQANALPQIFPPFPGESRMDIFASMTPAKDVGGDFYDFFLIDDNTLALVIADVSGKGIPAALFMMTAKTLIKSLAMEDNSPGECLASANKQLCDGNDDGMFVTAFLVFVNLDTGLCTYSNAGHVPPAIMNTAGGFEFYSVDPALMLGAFDNIEYKTGEFKLDPGDKIFLYTDGATDGIDKDENLYGDKRLLLALNRFKEGGPEEILKSIKEDIDSYCAGMDQFDDITMLCLHYKG